MYIIIADFDGWTQTSQCLAQLYRSSFTDIVVVVVDHGLTDETEKGLKDYPDCVRLAASPDLWWTGATNRGIQFAIDRGATQIMLLNNDCFVNEHTIKNLSEHSDSSLDTLVAPQQYDARSGRLISANIATCFSLGFTTIELPSFMTSKRLGENLVSAKMIVGGRGVIIPTRVFEMIGVFDELNLPHYGADHDFYLRCIENNIALTIATNAAVIVDQTTTTVSRDLGRLSVREFAKGFSEPRSHRNMHVLTMLFKRHFPFRRLYFLGVLLNVTRYTLIFMFKRTKHLLFKRSLKVS